MVDEVQFVVRSESDGWWADGYLTFEYFIKIITSTKVSEFLSKLVTLDYDIILFVIQR